MNLPDPCTYSLLLQAISRLTHLDHVRLNRETEKNWQKTVLAPDSSVGKVRVCAIIISTFLK